MAEPVETVDSQNPIEDIEEFAGELDGPEKAPPPTSGKGGRDVLTSVVEYSLPSLKKLLDDGRINLSPKYQRRERWGADRQSKLIESFLMGVPIPPIYLNEDKRGTYSVIDGKQRLLSIGRFFADDLALTQLTTLTELEGLTYSSLPSDVRSYLETLPSLRTIVLLSDSKTDIKFQVFLRLNRGGVQLNAQEIRNSTWPGDLNDLILELSGDTRFHRLLGIVDPSRSVIFQQMRDAELVLRFFTFRSNWRTFTGGIAAAMNDFMEAHQYADADELTSLRQAFVAALDSVEATLGEHAFRRFLPESGGWKNQVLAALFDAEMLALAEFPAATLAPRRAEFLARFIPLFSDSDFRQSIDAATNTPALFQYRISTLHNLAGALLK